MEEIAEILADPDARAADHLRRQHRLLRERKVRTQALLSAVEKEMEARQMGISLTPAEQFEIFGTDSLDGAYSEEAEQRWGDTDRWAQSHRRTVAYTREDWIAIKSEADANLAGFAGALDGGESTAGPVAASLVEAEGSKNSIRRRLCREAGSHERIERSPYPHIHGVPVLARCRCAVGAAQVGAMVGVRPAEARLWVRQRVRIRG